MDSNTDSAQEATRPFRIQNKWVYLTYSTCEFDKNEYRQWLRDKQPSLIADIQVAKEKHKDGQPHMHVLITYKKAFQTRNCKFWDYKIHPNIKGLKTAKDYAKVLCYISKEDEDMHVPVQVVEANSVWQSDSLAEAMLKVSNPLSAKMLWDNRPSNVKWEEIPAPKFGWQTAALECLSYQEINWFRAIVWIMGEKGNEGKTVLGTWAYQQKIAWYINHIGTVRDMALNIKVAIDSGWNGEMLIIDLPRDAKDYKSLYSCLEMLKSGLITQTKYQCGNVEIPHGLKVVVLANWWPDFTRNSMDRWLCWEIVDKDTLLHKDVGKLAKASRRSHRCSDEIELI